MTTTEHTDPVPVEIRDRIQRAREATSAAIRKDPNGDYAAYLREIVAAERALSDAYEAAWTAVPLPFQTLHYALLDAYHALRARANNDELEACKYDRATTATKGNDIGAVA